MQPVASVAETIVRSFVGPGDESGGDMDITARLRTSWLVTFYELGELLHRHRPPLLVLRNR